MCTITKHKGFAPTHSQFCWSHRSHAYLNCISESLLTVCIITCKFVIKVVQLQCLLGLIAWRVRLWQIYAKRNIIDCLASILSTLFSFSCMLHAVHLNLNLTHHITENIYPGYHFRWSHPPKSVMTGSPWCNLELDCLTTMTPLKFSSFFRNFHFLILLQVER